MVFLNVTNNSCDVCCEELVLVRGSVKRRNIPWAYLTSPGLCKQASAYESFVLGFVPFRLYPSLIYKTCVKIEGLGTCWWHWNQICVFQTHLAYCQQPVPWISSWGDFSTAAAAVDCTTGQNAKSDARSWISTVCVSLPAFLLYLVCIVEFLQKIHGNLVNCPLQPPWDCCSIKCSTRRASLSRPCSSTIIDGHSKHQPISWRSDPYHTADVLACIRKLKSKFKREAIHLLIVGF